MEIKERRLKGVFEIKLNPIIDPRGFFMRTYDINELDNYGLSNKWVQENQSRSEEKGIIRGLHFQLPPFDETKLVRCIRGGILDVFVDLRKGSSTFGEWDSIELTEENKKLIYIPRGFAHGFCTLTDESEVFYKVDNFYNKDHERGLIWNDKDINIDWSISNPFLSEKDKKNMSFKDFVKQINSIG
jgi:dTDP-4-dehydrorhamnose 3,5-epimerase